MKNFSEIVTVMAVIASISFSCGSKNEDTATQKISPDSLAQITGYGKIEPLDDKVSLTSERNGIVVSLNVSEGDTISAGDTILILDHTQEQAELEKIAARIGSAEVSIRKAGNDLEIAREELNARDTYLKRIKDAWDHKAESGQNLDNARLQYKQAASKLEGARLSLENQRRELDVLTKEYAESAIRLSKSYLTSPANGTVLSLDITRGDPVTAYSKLGELAPAGPLSVRGEIDELFANRVKNGQAVKIVPFGRQETVATGSVVFTSPELREKSIFSDKPTEFNDRRVREIKVRINNITKPVLIGERVNILIEDNH